MAYRREERRPLWWWWRPLTASPHRVPRKVSSFGREAFQLPDFRGAEQRLSLQPECALKGRRGTTRGGFSSSFSIAPRLSERRSLPHCKLPIKVAVVTSIIFPRVVVELE